MKKILFALASIWMLVSCANSAPTYDVCFMNLSEEEKALFEAEIGVNDVSYLADLAEKYKVSDRNIINVIKLDSLSTLDDIFDLDKKIATVTLNVLNEDKALGLNDEVIENIMNQPYTIVNDRSCAGMYYDMGDITITYMLFGDEVSYTSGLLNKASITEWTKARRSESEYKDKSETDLRVLLHLLQISRSEYPGFYSGITKTLSTGQKVRISFTAVLK